MKKIFDPDRRVNLLLCKTKGHLWRTLSRSANLIGEICYRCEERRHRAATKEEKRWFRCDMKGLLKTPEVHRLHHAFDRATILKDLGGYPMMLAGERWSKKHPDRILVSGVDDSHFASSDLIFLTHEDPDHREHHDSESEPYWMGVSVYYVPQCSGEKPIRFFLYPNHLRNLIATLEKLEKRMRTFPNIKREDRWARRKSR